MFGRKDAFEKWLSARLDQTKQRVAEESQFSVQHDKDMRHTVMRLVHENGRDLLQVVMDVYQKFKKGEDISKE